jgi:hypothetical protein
MKITLDLDQRALNLLRIACENVDMNRAWSRDLDCDRLLERRYDLATLADTLSNLERSVHTTDCERREVHFNWYAHLGKE